MESKKKIEEYLSDIEDFKVFDTDKEWDSFLAIAKDSDIEEKDEMPKVISLSTAETRRNRRIYLSIAASLVVLIAAYFTFFYSVPEYKKVITAENSIVIPLDDGSSIQLAKESEVLYPISTQNKEERKIFLTGDATFDVAESDKPFIVEMNGTAIKVLGTVFKVDLDEDATEVENIEGQIKFFEIANEENGIVLNPGDKIRYEGGTFSSLNPVLPEYTIQEILNYLFTTYEDKVRPAAAFIQASKYDPGAIVHVDLTVELKEIINQLDTSANFQYTVGDCDSCYVIEVFKGKE